MNSTKKRLTLTGVLIVLGAMAWIGLRPADDGNTITYSKFLQEVQAGRVASVAIRGDAASPARVNGKLKDGSVVNTVLPADYQDAMAAMRNNLVDVKIQPGERWGLWPNAIPFLLLLTLWIVLLFFPPQHPKWRGIS